MSKIFTAKEICERALRAIGAFPVTESAPDGEQLREAMLWLDLNMAQIAGTERIFSLIPATIDLAITNGTQGYPLSTSLGANYPTDGLHFPVAAWLQDASGSRSPLEIVTRDAFESVSDLAQTGQPCRVYIDRLESPTLKLWPTPAADDPTSYTVKLDVQTYAPNVAPRGVTGAQPIASLQHRFRQAWQRWLVQQLSLDLGSGPIFKLPESSLGRFEKAAKEALDALLAFENQEHETTPPIGDAWGEDIPSAADDRAYPHGWGRWEPWPSEPSFQIFNLLIQSTSPRASASTRST